MKTNARRFLLLWITLVVIGCGKKNETESGFKTLSLGIPPIIDHSTPDLLIKSFWMYTLWYDTTLRRDTSLNQFLAPKTVLVVSKNEEDHSAERVDEFKSWSIVKVAIESDSRAVVLARVPKDTVTYILTKDGDNWLIEDYVSRCYNCSGKGQETDYDKWAKNGYRGQMPTKECPVCKGKGDRSSYFN